jgi:hydrogenase maturation protease
MADSSLIVGVGNRHRGDDAAGPEVARRLAAHRPAGIRVVVNEGNLLSLLDDLPSADLVVIVDSAMSGAPPGTIRRFDLAGQQLPAEPSRASTHAFGLAQALDLARVLGRLPARLVVFGIEGRDFGFGDRLSPEVEAAVDEVIRRVIREIRPR